MFHLGKASLFSALFVFCRLMWFECVTTNRSIPYLERLGQKTHTSTNSYSISSRGKQHFKTLCRYRHASKNLLSFRSCRIYNSLPKTQQQSCPLYRSQLLYSTYSLLVAQVRCWEVQQTGQTVPKAEQSHTQPVLDVAWSDVSNTLFPFLN